MNQRRAKILRKLVYGDAGSELPKDRKYMQQTSGQITCIFPKERRKYQKMKEIKQISYGLSLKKPKLSIRPL